MLVLIVAAILVIVLLGFPENSLLGQKKNTPTIKQQTLAGKRENVTNNFVIIVSFLDLK